MIFEILIVLSAAMILVVLSRRFPGTADVGTGHLDNVRFKLSKYLLSGLKNIKIPKINLKIKIPKIGLKDKTSITKVGENNMFINSGDLMLEADIALQQGNLKLAEEKYLKLARIEHKNDKVYSRLGVIYLKQKNYADARDAFIATLKIDDRIASRHYNLAITYIALGATEKAKVSIKKAIELDPTKEKFQRTLNNLNQEKLGS